MTPKILFFCPVPDFKGGAEVVLADMLRNPGIAPAIAVPAEGPIATAARAAGISVAIIPFGAIDRIRRPLRPATVAAAIRDLFRAARALKAAARALGADLVHSNGLKAHAIAALARLLRGPRLVVHIHDLPVYRMEGPVWRALGKVATQVVVVSRPCWPGDALPDHVTVVHNGFVPAPQASAPPAPPPVIVGFCGRLHPFKGLHVLPEWLAACREAGLAVRLVVRGEAAPEHADYVAGVEARFAALDLAGQVVFEGRREGLAAIYGGLHAVVVPSDTPDPLPRSVMEAMGLGLPVIGYPAGGIPEMIVHDRNGWLVRDPQGFVDAVRIVAEDGPRLAAIRERALRTVAEDLSLDVMYARLDQVYARALRNG